MRNEDIDVEDDNIDKYPDDEDNQISMCVIVVSFPKPILASNDKKMKNNHQIFLMKCNIHETIRTLPDLLPPGMQTKDRDCLNGDKNIAKNTYWTMSKH